jgi:Protein of unknown function (DUF2848)
MPTHLRFACDGGLVEPEIRQLVLVGFSGRDRVALDRHIADMALAGIKPPAQTPCLYAVIPGLLTQQNAITVLGPHIAPEVEFVLFTWLGRQYLTIGTDLSDLEVERLLSAEKAKNLCAKPVARAAWPLDGVVDHWDELRLNMACDGVVVQDSAVSEIMRPETLFRLIEARLGGSAEARMIFSGTIAALGNIPSGAREIAIRLSDPIGKREINHDFRVTHLSPLDGA